MRGMWGLGMGQIARGSGGAWGQGCGGVAMGVVS